MIYVFIALLGLCLGSFVNAWVWRLREQSKPKTKRAAKDSELSITKGRSMCPDCKHTLTVKDLIPVLSWLSLGGKCRYCRKPISWQYPLVEILTSALFILAYQNWSRTITQGQSLQTLAFCTLLVAIVVGVALAVYDFKWMLLPDKMVKIIAVIGLVYVGLNIIDTSNFVISIWYLALAISISGGLFYLLFQVSGGKWIGGGDVKLGAALGLFLLTPINAAIMLFAASLLGCMYALALMVTGKYKKNARVPFGPFLLFASYLVIIYGERLLDYYKQLLFL